MPCQPSRHWIEIECSVGNVEREHATRRQTPLINVRALSRQQMHRYRITGKRIHRDQVEISRAPRGQFAFQLHARIAQYNFGSRLRVIQERKPRSSDLLYIRIDFVEAE